MKFVRQHSDSLSALGLTLGALILYVRTLAPGVLDGDSGEWQYMIPLIGVAHSTGYPLYILLGKFFTLLVPVGSIAYRINLLSAVCASLAVGVFYLLAVRVSHNRIVSALVAALLAIAPTLWASAVKAEVYALNTLLGVVVIYLAWEWYEHREPRHFLLLAFSLGLALDNHRVIAFLVLGLLLLLWFTRQALNPRRLVIAVLLVLLPLTLYAYIPFRAAQLISQQDPANWQLYQREDAFLKGTVSAYYRHSVDGFINLVLAFDNRNKLGFQDPAPSATISARTQQSASLLLDQFGWLGIALGLAGAVIWFKRERKRALIFFTSGAGIAAIGFFLRGESTQFYFSLAYTVLALCIAVALARIDMSLRAFFAKQSSCTRNEIASSQRALLAMTSLYVLASLWLVYTFVQNYARLDNSANSKYVDYAQTVLNDNLAPNAVVVAGWEIATPLRYYQFVEGQRTDLLIIHESPVRPQYQKLYDGAHQLARPFYLVQFTPEDQLAPGPRYVQAIALPLSAKPSPQYPLSQKIAGGVTVVGYDLSPNPPQPGQMTRVEIYYHADSSVHEEFEAELAITDLIGNTLGDYTQTPVTEYHRTYFWNAGEYYRDVWYWNVPGEALKGLDTAELSWFNLNQNRAETRLDLPLTMDTVLATTNPTHAQTVTFGDESGALVQLHGYDLAGARVTNNSAVEVPRGETLSVSLYLSAARKIDEPYTVFLHLLDGSGVLRAQIDSQPFSGNFPMLLWAPGEIYFDTYKLKLPADLTPGEYSLTLGMYATPDRRLPILDTPTNANEITLLQIRVLEK